MSSLTQGRRLQDLSGNIRRYLANDAFVDMEFPLCRCKFVLFAIICLFTKKKKARG